MTRDPGSRAPAETRSQIPRLVAKNSAYNLAGQALLIVLALAVIPSIVPALGETGFGLLSLVWVAVGYFSLLDFGVGRALTRLLSESLARKDPKKAARVLWTSVWMSSAAGIAIAAVLAALAPALSWTVTGSHPELRELAVRSLRIAAAGIPFVLLFGIFRGALSSLQRFFLLNQLQLLVGIGQWGGALAVVLLGYGVEEILLITVGVRCAAVAIAASVLPRHIPGFYEHLVAPDRASIRELLGFGGWITISQVIGHLLAYADRILVGVMLSLTAVAYYTVPQEGLLKLLIIPLSLTSTLFPALTEYAVSADRATLSRLYQRSFRYMTALLLPIVAVCVVYAGDILRLWIGPDYAANGTAAFRILAAGMFFSGLAQIPTVALQASNRPDLCAKFHLVETPIALGVMTVLIPFMGIKGAAIGWSFRVVLDAVLLYRAAARLPGGAYDPRLHPPVGRNMLLTGAGVLGLAAAAMVVPQGNPLYYAFAPAVLLGYPAAVWAFCLDAADRGFLRSLRAGSFAA